MSLNQAYATDELAGYNISFQLDFLLYLTDWSVKEDSGSLPSTERGHTRHQQFPKFTAPPVTQQFFTAPLGQER